MLRLAAHEEAPSVNTLYLREIAAGAIPPRLPRRLLPARAGLLSARHVLQHGHRADVGSDGAPIDGAGAASRDPGPADGRAIERGSVVCFNYPEYHRLGFDHPDSFEPDRWRRCPVKDANHIPFGMPRNRPCPAMRVAHLTMRRLTRCLLRRYRFATSAGHTRSLPNRGPCLVAVRD